MKDKLKEQFKDLILQKITNEAWKKLTTEPNFDFEKLIRSIIKRWEEEKARNKELGIE